MTEWVLDAKTREPQGKGGARRLRREGMVPAIIYGLHDPQPIQVPEREAFRLVHLAHGVSRMITLRVADGSGNGAAERQVLMKEVQTTPVGAHLVHIDFNEIDTAKKVRVNVEVRAVGIAEGVNFGGTMQTVMHEVPVECLPSEMPDFIEADVTALEIGHSLHVSDLVFPSGVTPVVDESATVIVISGMMREEVEEVEEEELLEGEEALAAEGEEGAAEGEEGGGAATEDAPAKDS